VQNTWYPVLAATGLYTFLRNICLRVETANETIELEVTVEGIVDILTLAATFGTTYIVRFSVEPSLAVPLLNAIPVITYNLDLIGHDISVRIRKTTAAGAGTLRAKVVYAVL